MAVSTPVRRQYLQLKRQHPDAILFFRMGDFYEAFDEDAKTIARELNIVLTAREAGKGNKVPMAGVPHHAAENYIARLVQAGYKVAICEQVGKEAVKGLMPREVVRVVTPGTVVEPALLDAKQPNYLACLVPAADGKRAGLAYVDITTGEFAATVLEGSDPDRLSADELARLQPAELLLPEETPPPNGIACPLTRLERWQFEPTRAAQILRDHFGVATLDGFGLAGKTPAVQAAGAILQYLTRTQKGSLAQITALRVYSTAAFMVLDSHTRRNLEITHTLRGQKGKGSLVEVLDRTITPMGGRLLRNWLQQPLLDLDALNRRLDAVEAFFHSTPMRAEIRQHLKGIADLERLTSRLLQGIAHPRDLLDLRLSLEKIPPLQNALQQDGNPQFAALAQTLDPCPEVVSLLRQAIVDDPPAQLSKGGVIRPGFSAELDAVLSGSRDARRWIASLEGRERQRTGIKTLKVGFNKVFGYYLEVTKANLDQVPPEYIRKQTLVNAERYITPELKEYETLILNAEERQVEIETRIFQEIVAQAAAHHRRLYQTAGGLAHLDVYRALGEVAAENNYVRPTLTTEDRLDIVEGRHPVVEQTLQASGGAFVPNDTHLSREERIWILTGPNMAGKSTLLRQVALIVLLAQIGSFVPAREATIGLVDRIFTRIGAQDEIYAGQSTFMVEMVETAALLSQSTRRSLLILDEIGRGTSTYDGLAIARAIIEYIHNNPNLQARTLFATHYHELVALEKYLPGVKNYNVAVTEEGGDIVFLHKIVPGGADRSYGVHVAQLAGIPRPVINRANEILSELENDTARQKEKDRVRQTFSGVQLSFLGPETHPVVEKLKALKIEELSPLEALNKLYELQQEANTIDD
ncbi:MAG: DNA mismatch repair protein MutS [Caldilineae bacterium]|nr:MAG: DNA mismatch repair protein MutS [Caldilineae bacterium]